MSPVKHLCPQGNHETKQLEAQGIPFKQIIEDKRVQNLAAHAIPVGEQFERLFFLGMTTQNPEGSEWWGQAERFHNHSVRCFLGDRLGRVYVIFEDNTIDVIPLIYGVNIWNYELIDGVREDEPDLLPYEGPFTEPFASDEAAAQLRDASLLLTPNDAGKDARYIFSFVPRPKRIERIEIHPDGNRHAGVRVTAITGVTEADALGEDPAALRHYDAAYFIRQGYRPALDGLARRLYQFRDMLPSDDKIHAPEGYAGPLMRCTGTPQAALYATTMHYNLHDIRVGKIDPDGSMHTSTKGSPTFGFYVGCGTFKNGKGQYYKHVWTRDVGRSLMEAIHGGEQERVVPAADKVLAFLDDGGLGFDHPHWKRITNVCELVEKGEESSDIFEHVKGKENDGHATMMLFYHAMVTRGLLSRQWCSENWEQLTLAPEWILWEMENPEKSGFEKVLASETEAALQLHGHFDIFSNTLAWLGLRAFAKMAGELGQSEQMTRWQQAADRLWSGIEETFTCEHPRLGKIFVDDVYDCWTWEYKRFAPLFLAPDFIGFDLARLAPELWALMQSTWLAQKEDYFSYAAGRQMGYGQGYLTQTAILLDQAEDMQGCLEQSAAFCYHHTDHPYIVPEGVIMHPSGRFWFRNGDLSNSVQQAEIAKTARLLLGVDMMSDADRLHLVPRLPANWSEVGADRIAIDLPKLGTDGIHTSAHLSYRRRDQGYELVWKSDMAVPLGTVRLGPFPLKAQIRLLGTERPFTLSPQGDQGFVYIDFEGEPLDSLALTVNAG